jgi:aconitate hydratase
MIRIAGLTTFSASILGSLAAAACLALSAPAMAQTKPPNVRPPAGVAAHRAGVRAAQLRWQEGHRRQHVEQLANWKPGAERSRRNPLRRGPRGAAGLHRRAAAGRPGRDAQCGRRMGKNPKTIEPLVPVDLVVDHSVMIDHYGSKKALDLNMKLEFQRNRSAMSS